MPNRACRRHDGHRMAAERCGHRWYSMHKYKGCVCRIGTSRQMLHSDLTGCRPSTSYPIFTPCYRLAPCRKALGWKEKWLFSRSSVHGLLRDSFSHEHRSSNRFTARVVGDKSRLLRSRGLVSRTRDRVFLAASRTRSRSAFDLGRLGRSDTRHFGSTVLLLHSALSDNRRYMPLVRDLSAGNK